MVEITAEDGVKETYGFLHYSAVSYDIPEGFLEDNKKYRIEIWFLSSSNPNTFKNSVSILTYHYNPISEPCEGDFEPDGDVDGIDLAFQAVGGTNVEFENFALHFGRKDCL